MSRVQTFLVILLVILVSVVIHTMSVALFPTMQDSLAHENGDTFNQEKNMQDMYLVLSIWVPIIMDGGVIVWGLAREYERQKDTAVQVRRRS
jgi:hypothetical protein